MFTKRHYAQLKPINFILSGALNKRQFLRPNHVRLGLKQKSHQQCNPSKFLVDNLQINKAVLMTIDMVEV